MEKLLKAIAGVALDFADDQEKMEAIWEWAEDRAKDTDTSWDDVAVASAKAVWPHLVEIADRYFDELD